MRLEFSSRAFNDLQLWINEDPKTAKQLVRLIQDCPKDPFKGIGKPEPLKGNLSGFWSKRITGEHRLVYRVEEDSLFILQAKVRYS